jgi:outer membrane protein assembly factor BamD|tara:strand:- start:15 stop:788 length:774 start_codon:yes stop_codon:yes gene_type:complete
MIRSLILLILFSIFLSGCSLFGGDKEARGPIADGLTPKTLYDLAEIKFNSGSIDQGIEQLEVILAAYPGSKYAIQARLDIAYNLFKRQKYTRAILELNEFIERYPALPSTPYAYYLRGIIAEEKSSSILDDIITDSAQRDIQSVREAYNYFSLLINTFPNSKYSEEALKKLVVLKNVLARHEFYVALYYTNNGSHIAAINRSKYIIEHYPNSPSVADGLHLMAHNYDAINAEELAEDTRTVLYASYPQYSPNYKIDR